MAKATFKITGFIFFLAFVETVVYLSFDMSLPALPQFAAAFNVTQEISHYGIILWSVGAGSVQLLFAPLADRWGKKQTLLIGILLFLVASLVCALTLNITWFFIGRFIQGMTVCFICISGYSLVHELSSTKDAISALSMLSAITVIAPAIGPSLGGVIVYYFSWRYIFYLFLILGIIGFIGLALSMQVHKVKQDSASLTLNKPLHIYSRIVSNFSFMRYSLIFAISIAGLIIWNVQSSFLIILKLGKTEIFYGVYQGAVFSFFVIGSFLAKYLNHNNKSQYILLPGLIISVLANIFLYLITIFINDIMWALPTLMFYAFGAAMPLGLLNRYAVDASTEATTMKMAMLSTLITVFVLILNYVVIYFDIEDLHKISILLCVVSVINFILYLIKTPKSKLQLQNLRV